MYKILYCKKLDWLKKEKYWKPDKIDYITWIIFGALFILTNIYGKSFLPFFLLSFLPLIIVGEIRHIKNVSGDIESKLMYPLLCARYIFFAVWSLMLISFLLS